MDRISMWQLFLAGGPVMWPILLCSVLALAITVERLRYLGRIRAGTQGLLQNILDNVKRHQIKEALQVCENNLSPLSRILKAGTLKYDRTREQIKEAIADASLYEIPRLEKNLPALATIAQITPLLGFLGTVMGMIKLFQAVQAKSAAMYPIPAADLAAGIWEALIATVAGLIVAIPAFAAYNYLAGRINSFILEMEKSATELVNFLTE